ncbi:MAG: small multi-drug export protein [Chloroflexi bacterium]|nr:small multi-drug export protein [Chloroflexota bacterium]
MFFEGIKLNPLLLFAFTMMFSALAFVLTRLLVEVIHSRLSRRWLFLKRWTDTLWEKGAPVIKRHGILGLALFVAVPIPGTGVYAGAVLSWLIGLEWHRSFLAVVPATVFSNIILTAGITGMLHGITFFG